MSRMKLTVNSAVLNGEVSRGVLAVNKKKRALYFDDMELYQEVLNNLCKQNLIFIVRKDGCKVMRDNPNRRQNLFLNVGEKVSQGQSIGGEIIRPRDRATHGD